MVNPFSNPSYLLSPLVALVISFILIIVVLSWGRRGFNSWIFCGFLLSVGLWGFLIFGMRLSPDVQHAIVWNRVAVVPAIATFVLYYHFTLIYTNARGQKGFLLASYLLLAIVAAFIPTDLVIKNMRLEDYGYAPIQGPLSLPLSIATLPLLGGGVYNLLRRYKASTSYEERNRLLYLAIAILFPVLGAFLDAFTDLPPMFIWSQVVFYIVCSIAILKYHLLDIRIVLRKSLVYLLISVMVATPYVTVLISLNQALNTIIEPWWTHALLILFLAIILQPLHSWAQRFIDRLFYRDRYSYLKALEQFSQKAQSVVDLKELSSTLTRLISGALRTSSVCLLLPSESGNGLIVVSSTGLGNPPYGVVLRNRSPLIKWLKRQQRILSSEEFNIVPQLQSLSLREKNNLKQMEAKLCVPILTGPGQLSGILVLGQKLSQQSYSREDKQLLTTVSNQMAMALENARLYNESQQEVEERKRAEELYRVVTNSSPVSIHIIQDGKIAFANRQFLKETGYAESEVLDRLSLNIVHPEDRETVRESAIEMLKGKRLFPYDFRYIRKSGEVRWSLGTIRSIQYEGKRAALANFIDITERKRLEEALQESEQKHRALFEELNDAAFLADVETGRILDTNKQGEVLLGRTREEIIGMHQSELHPPEMANEYRQRFATHIQKGHAADYDGEVIRKDGSIIQVNINAAPITIRGNHLIFGLFRDITERKRAEEREREMQQELLLSSRLASIGELAAGVAHEINNPLTGIVGFSERLLRRSTDDETTEELQVIHDEAKRAAIVVRNLLELRAYELKTGNIEVVTDLAPVLCEISVNFQQIQQVFLNVIVNAEQAISEANRGGKLHIKTEKTTGYVRISFTDDGPGIPAEHLDKLFDPFFTTRGEKSGTGLGLSICHGIVTEHGGRIYAKTKPGKGATFFVELPLVSGTVDKSKVGEEGPVCRDK